MLDRSFSRVECRTVTRLYEAGNLGRKTGQGWCRYDSDGTSNRCSSVPLMEIQQLRVFLAVAEELHFGRAAEKLHMAQPPISRTVRQLERELGAPLFERNTRSVRLTAAGEALVQPARAVFEDLRRAASAVAAAGRGEVGRVRVAYAGASTHVMVGRLARAVRQAHPGIQFELYSQNFALPALSRLLRGEMEIAFGRWDHLPAGVAARVVADDSLVVAVPAGHRLAGQEAVRMSELEGEPFVSLPPHEGAVLTDRLRRLSHSAGFSADVVQIAPDSWTAISLVAAEVGCTLTLSTVAENVVDAHVRFLRVLDETDPVVLRMVWREDDDSAALRVVLALSDTIMPPPVGDPQRPGGGGQDIVDADALVHRYQT